ncbi:MAG: hypothetical protein KJ808_02590 [Acidobacteria bacterium]|nr:hypothetical protein [Acidobacteriota bacterium]MBU4307125.1 hypothetical protein [Acidobacteriota bacterium]MCG2812648.1 hypothetical protein [Candidatus Aminicenantes bacterium]
MDIKEKASGQLNWLEKVLHKIPGFRGYYEKELRRDSDRLQREFIVKQLRKVKNGLNGMLQAASRQKNFELLQVCDLFGKSLEKSIGEIRYADQGYSGFFDLIKIKEAELDAVYEWDAKIAEMAVSFTEEFKNVATLPLESSQLETLREQLDQINGAFEQRTALLKGY